MENRTGRLDLLLLGILERLTAANPVARTAFEVFQPEIREFVGAFDIPELRRALRKAQPKQKREKRERKPKLGVKQVKRIPAAAAPVEVVEAEWVS
jgi:hypothetical protein